MKDLRLVHGSTLKILQFLDDESSDGRLHPKHSVDTDR